MCCDIQIGGIASSIVASACANGNSHIKSNIVYVFAFGISPVPSTWLDALFIEHSFTSTLFVNIILMFILLYFQNFCFVFHIALALCVEENRSLHFLCLHFNFIGVPCKLYSDSLYYVFVYTSEVVEAFLGVHSLTSIDYFVCFDSYAICSKIHGTCVARKLANVWNIQIVQNKHWFWF